ETIKIQILELACEFCGVKLKVTLGTSEIPSVCPGCKRRTLKKKLVYFIGDAFNAPAFVAYFKQTHEVIATRDTGQIMVYDEKAGKYDKNGEAVIRETICNSLGILYKDKYLTEVRSYLIGTSYVNRDQMHGSVYQDLDGEIHINLKNGTYLVKAKKLVDHDPKDMFTVALPFSYIKDAKPKKILDFFWSISEPDYEKYMTIIETFGWILLPTNRFQKLVLLWGEGENGKSVLLALVIDFVGADNASSVTLDQLQFNRFMRSALYGKLVNVAGDLPDKPLVDTGFLKAMRGGDVLTVEEKNKPAFQFVPQARNFFSANKFPKTQDDTRAFYRSWLIIYLQNVFSAEKGNVNRNLKAEITTEEELAGLFNLLVDYFLPLLIARDDFTFAPTPEETASMYDRKSDSAKVFIEQCLEADPLADMPKADLWDAYTKFVTQEGLLEETEKAFRMTLNASGLAFSEHRVQGAHWIKGLRAKNYKPDPDKLAVQARYASWEDFLKQYEKRQPDGASLPTLPTFFRTPAWNLNIDKIEREIGENLGNVGKAVRLLAQLAEALISQHLPITALDLVDLTAYPIPMPPSPQAQEPSIPEGLSKFKNKPVFTVILDAIRNQEALEIPAGDRHQLENWLTKNIPYYPLSAYKDALGTLESQGEIYYEPFRSRWRLREYDNEE
ncbi:MAG: hypothetical protein KGH64_03245, partial [Candidatus Micrarchaeota archaeon]|nr:hypothetical protein [Candidatus Micrarchaeota archaeon]